MPTAIATAITKTNISNAHMLVTELNNTNAIVAALSLASPTITLMLGAQIMTQISYSPSANAAAAIIADLNAETGGLTTQLAAFGVTS